MKHKFQVGDQVRIQRDYWERLAKDKNAIELYVRNGPDYVYTISQVDEYDGDVYISDYGDSWSDPERYLEYAEPEEDLKLDGQTLGDIL